MVAADGSRREAGLVAVDWDRHWLAAGGLARLARLDPLSLPEVPAGERWGAPVARPGKVVAIGLNYRDHAAETKARIPIS